MVSAETIVINQGNDSSSAPPGMNDTSNETVDDEKITKNQFEDLTEIGIAARKNAQNTENLIAYLEARGRQIQIAENRTLAILQNVSTAAASWKTMYEQEKAEREEAQSVVGTQSRTIERQEQQIFRASWIMPLFIIFAMVTSAGLVIFYQRLQRGRKIWSWIPFIRRLNPFKTAGPSPEQYRSPQDVTRGNVIAFFVVSGIFIGIFFLIKTMIGWVIG